MEQNKNKSTKDRLGDLKKLLDNDSQPTDNQPNKKVKSVKVKENKILNFSHLTDNQNQFLRMYIPYRFNITKICNDIGMSRRTFYEWTESNKEFNEALNDLKEYMLDMTEEAILNALESMDAKTAIQILKLKGKSRGYSESLDLTNDGEGFTIPIINIIKPKQDDLETEK